MMRTTLATAYLVVRSLAAEPLAGEDLAALNSALILGVTTPSLQRTPVSVSALGNAADDPHYCETPGNCRRLADIPNLLQDVSTTGTKDGVATAAAEENVDAVVNAWPIPDDSKADAAAQFKIVLVTEQSTEFQIFRLAMNVDAAQGTYSFLVGASRKVADGVQVGYVYSATTGTLVQQTETKTREWTDCGVNLFGWCVDHRRHWEDYQENRGNTAEELEQIATALQQSAEEYARDTLGPAFTTAAPAEPTAAAPALQAVPNLRGAKACCAAENCVAGCPCCSPAVVV